MVMSNFAHTETASIVLQEIRRMSTERNLKAEAQAAKGASGNTGKLVIVRASELAKNGTTGVVAEGILEKVEPNKFNPLKSDYFIRNEADDTLYIVNETQSLKEQLGQEGVIGLKVTIEYNGKIATKKGMGYHDFQCFAK